MKTKSVKHPAMNLSPMELWGKDNPYAFIGSQGHLVDWSAYVDQVAPMISGHDKPIAKEELAVIVGRKSRECDLARALTACKQAGESAEARLLFGQIIGN